MKIGVFSLWEQTCRGRQPYSSICIHMPYMIMGIIENMDAWMEKSYQSIWQSNSLPWNMFIEIIGTSSTFMSHVPWPESATCSLKWANRSIPLHGPIININCYIPIVSSSIPLANIPILKILLHTPIVSYSASNQWYFIHTKSFLLSLGLASEAPQKKKITYIYIYRYVYL